MAGKNLKSKSLAACGVLCSLGTVLLLVSGWIGVGTYAGPLLAVWILSPLPDLYGRKYAIMSWLVVSFLSLLLVSDKELVVVYLFFGWYPVLKKEIDKMPKLPRLLMKLAVYAVSAGAALLVVLYILGLTEVLEESTTANIIFFAVGALVFLLADATLDKMSVLLKKKLSRLL